MPLKNYHMLSYTHFLYLPNLSEVSKVRCFHPFWFGRENSLLPSTAIICSQHLFQVFLRIFNWFSSRAFFSESRRYFFTAGKQEHTEVRHIHVDWIVNVQGISLHIRTRHLFGQNLHLHRAGTNPILPCKWYLRTQNSMEILCMSGEILSSFSADQKYALGRGNVLLLHF